MAEVQGIIQLANLKRPIFNQCPVCMGRLNEHLGTVQDVELQTSTDHYTYVQCIACDVVFLLQPPKNKLDLIYPDTYYSYSKSEVRSSFSETLIWWVKEKLDSLLIRKILKNLSFNELKVLDVGGGDGSSLDLVKKIDPRFTDGLVVDLDKGAKKIVENKGHRFLMSTIEKAEIKNKFHFILMLNLIEHVADPRSVLKKLHSITEQGGRILIKTPNTNSLNFRVFKRFYWGGYHAPRHFVLFNEKNFTKVCQEIGFSSIKITRTQGAPQWFASIWGTNVLFKIRRNGTFPNRKFVDCIPSTALMSFAIFDYLFGFLWGTDQMFVVLEK